MVKEGYATGAQLIVLLTNMELEGVDAAFALAPVQQPLCCWR